MHKLFYLSLIHEGVLSSHSCQPSNYVTAYNLYVCVPIICGLICNLWWREILDNRVIAGKFYFLNLRIFFFILLDLIIFIFMYVKKC